MASGSEDFSACLLDDGALKPSIETGMHAVLPHRVVLHVHSINVLSWAVLDHGAQELSGPLEGTSWCWIPYRRPGAPLTREVLSKANIESRRPFWPHGTGQMASPR